MSLEPPAGGTVPPDPNPFPGPEPGQRPRGDGPDDYLDSWFTLAGAAGLKVLPGERLPVFLDRVTARVRELRASAGVTWADYTFPEGAFVAEVTATGSHGRKTWTFPPRTSFEDVAGSLGKHEAG